MEDYYPRQQFNEGRDFAVRRYVNTYNFEKSNYDIAYQSAKWKR